MSYPSKHQALINTWMSLSFDRSWGRTAPLGQFRSTTLFVELRRASDASYVTGATIILEADNT
jgi:hypothetical protein